MNGSKAFLIQSHQWTPSPLKATYPDWNGSKCKIQVEWETGEITFEPLSLAQLLIFSRPNII